MTNTSDPDQHHTGTGQTLPIRFTASGRDYARLWLRNLGLTLITLGLYLPFARAHRLRFFRQHTQVDGEALDFDGDGREMLRPHLLLCAVLLLYILIAHEMPLGAALLLLAALPFWPTLMMRSLRWRLEHTRWRGRRLAFHGDAAGARAVFLPAAAPLAVLLVGQALLAGPQAEFDDGGGWLVPALVSLALLALLALIAMLMAWLALPATAERLVDRVPAQIDRHIGRDMLSRLDQGWLQPSQLPATQQQDLRRRLEKQAAGHCPAAASSPWEAQFRARGQLGAPSAFGLPGGTIVITDDRLGPAGEAAPALLDTLCRELQQVQRRQGLRTLARQEPASLLLGLVFEDFSATVAVAWPVLSRWLPLERSR